MLANESAADRASRGMDLVIICSVFHSPAQALPRVKGMDAGSVFFGLRASIIFTDVYSIGKYVGNPGNYADAADDVTARKGGKR
jgi:hypothetical protein